MATFTDPQITDLLQWKLLLANRIIVAVFCLAPSLLKGGQKISDFNFIGICYVGIGSIQDLL